MRSRSPDERGTVTAELATVIPAVLVTVGLCLGSVAAVGQHLRLVDAAALAARSLGRGESPGRTQHLVDQLVPGSLVTVQRQGELLCATVGQRVALPLAVLPLRARACALDE
jgi:hypothetical protein